MCWQIAMFEIGGVNVFELVLDDMIGNESEWHRLEYHKFEAIRLCNVGPGDAGY